MSLASKDSIRNDCGGGSLFLRFAGSWNGRCKSRSWVRTFSKAVSPWNCVFLLGQSDQGSRSRPRGAPRKPSGLVPTRALALRVNVAVAYRTRAWQTIEIDLGPASGLMIDLIDPKVAGLAELGLPVTSPVRCLSLAEQVAQKLHACTSLTRQGEPAMFSTSCWWRCCKVWITFVRPTQLCAFSRRAPRIRSRLSS